ncbi:hypothetical protein T484DRAFT_1945144 [Baffinella frigidus]|nr:hypothetical protein T484DRAFT_1945144 [Cryptophyta sp. CCMP2293]
MERDGGLVEQREDSGKCRRSKPGPLQHQTQHKLHPVVTLPPARAPLVRRSAPLLLALR